MYVCVLKGVCSVPVGSDLPIHIDNRVGGGLLILFYNCINIVVLLIAVCIFCENSVLFCFWFISKLYFCVFSVHRLCFWSFTVHVLLLIDRSQIFRSRNEHVTLLISVINVHLILCVLLICFCFISNIFLIYIWFIYLENTILCSKIFVKIFVNNNLFTKNINK